jgi:hypothetical protein
MRIEQMTLHNLIEEVELDNKIDETLLYLFRENIDFFMFIEEDLNESKSDRELQKKLDDLLKKGVIEDACRYPAAKANDKTKLTREEEKKGLLVISDKVASGTFERKYNFDKLVKKIRHNFSDKMGRTQYNNCVKALTKQFNDYQEIIKKHNMENAKEGSAKDEDCNGAYCDLPGATEVMEMIKKHMNDFIDFLEKSFKSWKSIPVEIPIFVESLNDAYIQNITYRNLINRENIEIGFSLLESNLNTITDMLESMITEANTSKEILSKLRDNIRKFNKLVRDSKAVITELDPESDQSLIKDLNLKILKYDRIVKHLDKKVAMIASQN